MTLIYLDKLHFSETCKSTQAKAYQVTDTVFSKRGISYWETSD